MPVPLSFTPSQAAWAEEIEARVLALEVPGGPVFVKDFTTALMPDATKWKNGVIRNSTLNILAVSDGTNWIRQDTGAAI